MTGQSETDTLEAPTAGASASAGFEPGKSTHPLAEAGKDATERAGHLAERAADIGLQQADRGREQAASGLDSVAQSIRRVSTEMQDDQPAIANAGLTAADQADKVAQFLRQTDARQMISSAEDIARRQPLLFLGGAFLLGVAASRFIKAAGGGGSATGTGRGYRSAYPSGATSTSAPSDDFRAIGPGAGTRNAGF